MDPNATLDRIRELRETQTQFKEDRWDQMVEALDLVGQLDNWLTAKSKGGKGGCLPNDWDVS